MRIKMRKGVVTLVTALVAAVTAIAIGAIILGMLSNLITQLNLTNTTVISTLFSQTFNAYSLLIILPLILVAGAIIALMSRWGGGGT